MGEMQDRLFEVEEPEREGVARLEDAVLIEMETIVLNAVTNATRMLTEIRIEKERRFGPDPNTA